MTRLTTLILALLLLVPAHAFTARSYAERASERLHLHGTAEYQDLEYVSESQSDSVWSHLTERRAPSHHRRIEVSGVEIELADDLRAAWLELPTAQGAEDLVMHHLDAPRGGEWTVIEVRGNEVVWVRGQLDDAAHGARVLSALWRTSKTDERPSDVVVCGPDGAEAYWSESGLLRKQLERIYASYADSYDHAVHDHTLEVMDEVNSFDVRIHSYRDGIDAAFGALDGDDHLHEVMELRDRAYFRGN